MHFEFILFLRFCFRWHELFDQLILFRIKLASVYNFKSVHLFTKLYTFSHDNNFFCYEIHRFCLDFFVCLFMSFCLKLFFSKNVSFSHFFDPPLSPKFLVRTHFFPNQSLESNWLLFPLQILKVHVCVLSCNLIE